MSNLINIKNISKKYDENYVVKNCSFHVKEGDVLSFLGPNGAGKTTTMKMITGYLESQSGSIHINKMDIKNDPIKIKSIMGYVPEGSPLYEEMQVIDFLKFCGQIRSMKNDKIKSRIEFVSKELEIEPILYKKIETLSKGYKRRVGIAQAILHDPKILILDEPTDGLDPNQKQHIRELINKIKKNKAIIISTHILEEAEAMCNRILIMDKGIIIIDSTLNDLLNSMPYHLSIKLIISLKDLEKFKEKFQNHIEKLDIKVQNNEVNIIIPKSINDNILFYVNNILKQSNILPISITQHQEKLENLFRELTKTKENI